MIRPTDIRSYAMALPDVVEKPHSIGPEQPEAT